MSNTYIFRAVVQVKQTKEAKIGYDSISVEEKDLDTFKRKILEFAKNLQIPDNGETSQKA